jgi:hypothetical protein
MTTQSVWSPAAFSRKRRLFAGEYSIDRRGRKYFIGR